MPGEHHPDRFGVTWRETAAAAEAARQEARWGMTYVPDDGAALPIDLAAAARANGDQLFQVELPVAWVQGATAVDQAATPVSHPTRYDMLGAIEAQGWRLEHVAAAFVTNGWSATTLKMSSAGSEQGATHSTLMGLYVLSECLRLRGEVSQIHRPMTSRGGRKQVCGRDSHLRVIVAAGGVAYELVSI